MDTINKKNYIFCISVFLIFSYFIGFILGEDSTGGAYNDFKIHTNTANEIKNNILHFLFNYDDYGNAHSPVIILIFHLLNISDYPIITRIISLSSSLLIPVLFFKCLELRFGSKNKLVLVYLSCFVFISPYFRSLAYWPGSENLSIIFFLLSIYYYLKCIQNINKNDQLKYIFLNI